MSRDLLGELSHAIVESNAVNYACGFIALAMFTGESMKRIRSIALGMD